MKLADGFSMHYVTAVIHVGEEVWRIVVEIQLLSQAEYDRKGTDFHKTLSPQPLPKFIYKI